MSNKASIRQKQYIRRKKLKQLQKQLELYVHDDTFMKMVLFGVQEGFSHQKKDLPSW